MKVKKKPDNLKEVILELTLLKCNTLSKLNVLSLKGDDRFTEDIFEVFRDATVDYLETVQSIIDRMRALKEKENDIRLLQEGQRQGNMQDVSNNSSQRDIDSNAGVAQSVPG